MNRPPDLSARMSTEQHKQLAPQLKSLRYRSLRLKIDRLQREFTINSKVMKCAERCDTFFNQLKSLLDCVIKHRVILCMKIKSASISWRNKNAERVECL